MCIRDRLNAGKEELKQKIVKEVVEEGKTLALAYSESGSGVSFYYPETTAEKKGDKWLINGSKSMVTSAEYASYYMVIAKTGEGDRLFGSITSMDIEKALKEQHGLDVDKKKIEMKDNIKSLGTFNVIVKVYPDINANLEVIVDKE